MRKARSYLCIGIALALFAGCSERRTISNSDYSVVHPQSWNPDGHPGIYLYYKNKPLWFNVYCPNGSFHDGMLVFEGDVPESLFEDVRIGNESSASFQVFAIRGSGPPVILSERVLNRSLKGFPFNVKGLSSATNGLDINFRFNDSAIPPTNVVVLWSEIKAWLDEAEATAPIKNSRMGKYRYLPLKQP
jgi:hypothetical protein